MKAKILLADDEKDIIEFLKYNLEIEGFEVITACDGIEALSKINQNPDLILLDIMMPNVDGFEVCKRIRQTPGFEKTPVIFLTAKSGELDEIQGLELGANDYIKKPISPKKLIARVKANLRNLEPSTEPAKISIGPLVINKDNYTVFIDNKERIFPRKEFEVLYYLANHPGKVFSRDVLLKDIWGTGVYVVDRTIDVHIRKIREKLDGHSDLIETIKGVGYRFKRVE
jgi:two-component system alkaline phosphatase synthesis response regulator PhoP